MPAAVETMVSVRQVPWHGLGEVVEDQLTAAEALKKSGLDWEVEKRPIRIVDGRQIPDRFATVRTSDNSPLGIVGKRYTVLQNEAAFEFADSLVDDGSAKYETAGSLRGGSTIFLSMRIPEGIKVAGDDPIDLYLMLRNSHDGSSQATVSITPVRVVCMNTLNLALRNAKRTWGTRHSGSMEGRIEEARRALELTFEYVDGFKELVDELTAKKISNRKFEDIVKELTDVEAHAEGILEVYRNAENLNEIRGTAWGGVNAVGEYFDHGRNFRSDEAKFKSSINGRARRMRDEAQKLLLAA